MWGKLVHVHYYYLSLISFPSQATYCYLIVDNLRANWCKKTPWKHYRIYSLNDRTFFFFFFSKIWCKVRGVTITRGKFFGKKFQRRKCKLQVRMFTISLMNIINLIKTPLTPEWCKMQCFHYGTRRNYGITERARTSLLWGENRLTNKSLLLSLCGTSRHSCYVLWVN